MGTAGISALIGIAIVAAIFCVALIAGFGLAAGWYTWKRALAAAREHSAKRAMKKNINAVVEGAKSLCRQNVKGK